MPLTIYEMAHSPYCIPITQALTACGVPFERLEVPNWDRRAVIELTGGAYYQVPVLVHDDAVIYESTPDSLDVARYVDARFADGRLFPERHEGLQAIVVPFIENELEGLGFKLCDIHYVPAIKDLVARTMVLRHKERRFGRGCLDRWKAEEADLTRQMNAALQPFDQTLQHQPFLFGDAPVYADYALFGVLGNYTHGGFHQIDPKQKALRAWHERLSSFSFA